MKTCPDMTYNVSGGEWWDVKPYSTIQSALHSEPIFWYVVSSCQSSSLCC